MESHVRPGPPRTNARTELELPGARPTPPDLRAAYAFARENARFVPDDLAGDPGHRLFWVSERGWGSQSLRAHPDAFVIAGRHTRCEVLLADDPCVSLRHLLVRSVALPGGGVALRVLDLQSEGGLALADGTRPTSIVAEGPVALVVGSHALVAIPGHQALPDELPPATVAACGAGGPYRQNARPQAASRITLMPRLLTLGEPLPPRLGRLATVPHAVTLERDGRVASVRLSDEDLLGGVVIGRSEKCHSEALRRLTAQGTSRLHCLLLRDGDGVHAYDLASTQGTFRDGRPVRRVTLGARTDLCLGQGESAVRLTMTLG